MQLQHDLATIRRVLVDAHSRIAKADFTMRVTLYVWSPERWSANLCSDDSGFEWFHDVDFAMTQLGNWRNESLDANALARKLVMQEGDYSNMETGAYVITFPSADLAKSIEHFIDMTPPDISTHPSVVNALLILSPLEQKLFLQLAKAGDDARVSSDDIAKHCWDVPTDDETIRNVYRGIQHKLRHNREMTIVNAKKGYKIQLKK